MIINISVSNRLNLTKDHLKSYLKLNQHSHKEIVKFKRLEMEKLPLKVGELIESYVKLHCEGINVKNGIHLSDIFTDTESMECFYKLLSSNKNQLIENGIEVSGRRRYADNTKVRTYYYYYSTT